MFIVFVFIAIFLSATTCHAVDIVSINDFHSNPFNQEAFKKFRSVEYIYEISDSTGEKFIVKYYTKDTLSRTEISGKDGYFVTIITTHCIYQYTPADKTALKKPLFSDKDRKKLIESTSRELAEINRIMGSTETSVDVSYSVESGNAMEKSGYETICGEKCTIYLSKNPSFESRLWISNKTGLTMKSIVKTSESSITTEVKSLKIDPPIPNSFFSLPAGTQILDYGNSFSKNRSLLPNNNSDDDE